MSPPSLSPIIVLICTISTKQVEGLGSCGKLTFGKTPACDTECAQKYDYVTFPQGRFPVSTGKCSFGICWCVLNKDLPEDSNKYHRTFFSWSNKKEQAYYYRLNHGTMESRKNAYDNDYVPAGCGPYKKPAFKPPA